MFTVQRKHIKLIVHSLICFIALYALIQVDWGSAGFRIFGVEIVTREPFLSAIDSIKSFIGSDNIIRNMVGFSLVIVPLVSIFLLSHHILFSYNAYQL